MQGLACFRYYRGGLHSALTKDPKYLIIVIIVQVLGKYMITRYLEPVSTSIHYTHTSIGL